MLRNWGGGFLFLHAFAGDDPVPDVVALPFRDILLRVFEGNESAEYSPGTSVGLISPVIDVAGYDQVDHIGQFVRFGVVYFATVDPVTAMSPYLHAPYPITGVPFKFGGCFSVPSDNTQLATFLFFIDEVGPASQANRDADFHDYSPFE